MEKVKEAGDVTFHSGFTRDNPFHLTDRQLAFLNEYLVDFNASRACRVLGIPRETVSAWMKYDQMNKAIDAYLEKRRRENDELVTATLKEAMIVMTSDIRDYVEWDDQNVITLKTSKALKCSKAIKGIEKTKSGVRLILHDKVRGIELMMQGLGMLKKPKSDEGYSQSEEDRDTKTSLLEALTAAHEERRKLPKTTGGLLSVEAKVTDADDKD